MQGNHFRISNAYQVGLLGGLGVLTALLIGGMLVTIANILTYVFAAIFIALGLDPIVSWLEGKRIKRPFAILMVFTVLLGGLGAIVISFAPTLIAQSANFIQTAPDLIQGFTNLSWVKSLDARFDGGITSSLSQAGLYLADSANWPNMFGGLVQVGLGIFNGLTGGLIIIILSLYFMASLQTFKRFVYGLIPATKRDSFIDISEQIANAVGKYTIGQVAIATINASLALVMMLLMQVPFAVVLAALAFILALIPLVGSLISATLISLVALTNSTQTAVVMAIYFLIYMQIEAYVISPRIMNKAVSIPGAVVVVAALAGGALLGVLGALVAIPVAASVILILRQVFRPRQDNL
ncbi:MAG: AI-2E family transporter [Micrococcales bacterium]